MLTLASGQAVSQRALVDSKVLAALSADITVDESTSRERPYQPEALTPKIKVLMGVSPNNGEDASGIHKLFHASCNNQVFLRAVGPVYEGTSSAIPTKSVKEWITQRGYNLDSEYWYFGQITKKGR